MRRLVRGGVDAIRAWFAWRRMLRAATSRRAPATPIAEGHICLLAWYFPPRVTGGTYRPAALARYGTEAGLRFTVIAAPLHEPPSAAGRYLTDRLPPSVSVVRAAASGLRPVKGAVPELDGGALNAVEVWRSAMHAFPAHRPELVFATGPPFHTFVAGHLIAARFGVPLVLEYRDEWTECPFDFVAAGPADRIWEERCLGAAERVIFTTHSQMEHHLDVFPVLRRERCVVIPNGWEPEDLPSPAEIRPERGTDEGRRTISYTGNLGDHTPPESFLACLTDVVRRRPDLADRLTLRFVGQKSARAAAQLRRFAVPPMIETMEQVPKGDAVRILRESAGLLLFNAASFERYIPGKLYEYLAAGRPVLVYGAGGEVGSLIERLDAGLVVAEGDVSGLASALERLAAQPQGDPGISPSRSAWLERHTRRALALRTVELLRSVHES